MPLHFPKNLDFEISGATRETPIFQGPGWFEHCAPLDPKTSVYIKVYTPLFTKKTPRNATPFPQKPRFRNLWGDPRNTDFSSSWAICILRATRPKKEDPTRCAVNFQESISVITDFVCHQFAHFWIWLKKRGFLGDNCVPHQCWSLNFGG